MKKPEKVVRYERMNNLLAKLFGCSPREVDDFRIGLGDGSEISVSATKRSAEKHGVWGFTDNGVIRYWAKSDCHFNKIFEFLAHEIGHLNGRQYKDFEKEESKAVEFQEVAMCAYRSTARTWC